MILGLGAYSLDTYAYIIVIPRRTFNKVTLLGNTIFDAVHLKNRELNDLEILNLDTQELFGVDTVFLANFEGTLESGRYTSLSKPITKWRIRRKPVGSFTSKSLALIASSETTYTDNLQANRTQYEYQVSPVSDDGTEGVPVTTITESNFFGWYLCSTDNQTVYKFDMNIESDSIALNMDVRLFEGFTQYPVTRQGKRKYHTGGLRTMPYHINSQTITIDNGLLRQLQDFICNGEPKILKNTSGDLFKVQTGDFSYQYMDTFNEQPFTISFKFTQVGDGE